MTQHVELLNEAREITEKVIDELHIPGSGKKPRTYRKKARKQYLQIARSKKRTAKKSTQSHRAAAFIYQKKFKNN